MLLLPSPVAFCKETGFSLPKRQISGRVVIKLPENLTDTDKHKIRQVLELLLSY